MESRAAEIARIETTLTELAQMFNDMAQLVEAQNVQVLAIEQNAEQVSNDIDVGVVEIKKAVVSAKSARKMRWWCFGLFMVILVSFYSLSITAFSRFHFLRLRS